MVLGLQLFYSLINEFLMDFTVFIWEYKEWHERVQPRLSIHMDSLAPKEVKLMPILLNNTELCRWKLSSLLIVISDLR